MPDVQNKTKDEAKEELKKLGIQITYSEPVYEASETVEKDKVIRTDPPAGTELATKQIVTIYISSGKPIKTGTMPNVVGKEKKEAEQILKGLGLDLKVEIEEVNDNEVAKGLVILTDPEEGEEIKTGQTVTLQVSLGPKMFKMPALENLPYSEAYILLQELGYNMEMLDVKYENHDTIPQGTVMAQSVKAKEEISVNAVITLTVSNGPAATQPTPVTKDYTIVFATPPAEDCEIVIRDVNDNVVARMPVTAGTTQITVSLTDTGVKKYAYYFVTGTEEGDLPLAGEFEVNFDE
jgi:serine/threonine-protein kinase